MELYEYVHYGTDPDGVIGPHVKTCESCRVVVNELTLQVSPDRLPERLWTDMKRQLPSPARVSAAAQPEAESFFDRVYRMFRFPAVAVGVATAVLLCFVLLRAPEMPQSVIALSSAGWTNAPKPKSLQQGAKSAAIVLVLEDFDSPWPQKKIDRLYNALVPPVDVYDRFRIVSPREVRDALDRSDRKLPDTKAVIQALAKKMSLATVVVVTVTARGQAASVQVDAVDASSGSVTAQKTAANVPAANLEATVKELTLAALVPSAAGTDDKRK